MSAKESRPLDETDGFEEISSEFTTPVSADAPAHWDPQWRQFALKRKTEFESRKPLLSMEQMPAFWEGFAQPWGAWAHTVEAQGYDVAFLPWANNVVILDCDVKQYAGDLVVDKDNPNHAGFGPAVTKRGVDDLARTVQEHGHTMAEIATYTVRTKSGGLHLYFDRGGCEMTTRHHREDWRIDVIATPHNWVAAPPTPGYTVVRDRPVLRMPEWLCDIVTNINTLRRPVGGQRRQVQDERVRELRQSIDTTSFEDKSLLGAWLLAQGELIALADRHGGWNNTIFQVACDFFEVGFRQADIEKALLQVAKPWDEHQRRTVLKTIESARNYKSRDER